MTIDDPTKLELATAWLAGPMAGDGERMRTAMLPHATWSVPGASGVSGVAEGADAVIERALAVHDGGVSIELQHVHYGTDKVAVSLHNTGQHADVHLDQHVVIVFTLADGKIATAENLISDVANLSAFFAASPS